MTGNSENPWGLPAEGLPLTPSEGRAQYYSRGGPATSQKTRVYDNGTALRFGPEDPIAEPIRGGAFDSQFLQINAAIKDLQFHNLQSGSHTGSSSTNNLPYENFRTEMMERITLPCVVYPSGQYISVPSRHASVEVVAHLWSVNNKSDVPGLEHNGGTTDTRFRARNKPTFQANGRQTIKDFGGKQHLNRGGPSGPLIHRLGQNSGPCHSNAPGHPIPPRNASITPYTMQDRGTLHYRHPLDQQGPSYSVPIHAGQQRADQMHAERLRAERLHREEADRRYAHQMQYEEMFARETYAERAREENNYGRIYYSRGTFNTPAVAGFPPSFDDVSGYPQSHGMMYLGAYQIGGGQFPAEGSNANTLARARTSTLGNGHTSNTLDQQQLSRGRTIERDAGYTKANQKAKDRINAEWARELDRMNELSRQEGDSIGAGDIASGEALLQLRMGIHFPPPMLPERVETRARTPDHPPPQLTITVASPMSHDTREHVDGRSSAPILGAAPVPIFPSLGPMTNWPFSTGVQSARIDPTNRIFGELPGTVRSTSLSSGAGRRLYER